MWQLTDYQIQQNKKARIITEENFQEIDEWKQLVLLEEQKNIQKHEEWENEAVLYHKTKDKSTDELLTRQELYEQEKNLEIHNEQAFRLWAYLKKYYL